MVFKLLLCGFAKLNFCHSENVWHIFKILFVLSENTALSCIVSKWYCWNFCQYLANYDSTPKI